MKLEKCKTPDCERLFTIELLNQSSAFRTAKYQAHLHVWEQFGDQLSRRIRDQLRTRLHERLWYFIP